MEEGREERAAVVAVEVELGEAAETFSLEKTACSHGFFMLPPNRWDPLSLSLSRPLQLGDDDPRHHPSVNVLVRISHPPRSTSLRVLVSGLSTLSPSHHLSLLRQVKRMLRLSEADEKTARAFREVCERMGAPDCMREFRGRVFRSPTLFEDMVKCILLCNCQWPRTFGMAGALCQLQSELQPKSPNSFTVEAPERTDKAPLVDTAVFAPRTPAAKEPKRKRGGGRKAKTGLRTNLEEISQESEEGRRTKFDGGVASSSSFHVTDRSALSFSSADIGSGLHNNDQNCPTSEETRETCDEVHKVGSCQEEPSMQFSHKDECSWDVIGSFPCPGELANLDERFLSKRCNLGYRAGRILKLSQDIVEGRINLRQLEEICDGQSLSSYTELTERLKQINGFGPFTCANVLMCMGYYHAIPTDSETIRHLKQVHRKRCSIHSVQSALEEIYGRYAPFQFLAYWAELWNFYEERFGKLSAMPISNYKLITASNMKAEGKCRKKRTKRS